MRNGILALTVCALLMLATSARGQTVPVMIDLGTLGGSESYAALARAAPISERGQVVGSSTLADGSLRAFSWTQAGGMVDLGTLGGERIEAYGVNDNGQVVGTGYLADHSRYAFSWTQAGGMMDLGTLGGRSSYAYAVNNAGQVVGGSDTLVDTLVDSHAFLWTQAGGMIDLGALHNEWYGTPDQAWGLGINDAGQVVGISYRYTFPKVFFWTDADGMIDLTSEYVCGSKPSMNNHGQVVGFRCVGSFPYRAFSWTQEGGLIDLMLPGGWWSEASAVNDGGQVVGWSLADVVYPDTGSWHAFSWTRDGGLVDLGTLGGLSTTASAVNDRGQVVGSSRLPDGPGHAFSWTQAGGMVDLGALGGGLSEAYAVNESGQVAGRSQLADGSWHAVVWKTDPAAEIALLVGMIDDMALKFGTGASLKAKLASASAALTAGDTGIACDELASFISATSAQGGKKIPTSNVQVLVAPAADVRTMLQCP